MISFPRVAIALGFGYVLSAGLAVADTQGNPKAVSDQDGKYVDANGIPTFKVFPDGKVDWYTNAGYLRYSANCLQCHGPDALGSSYAPNLTDAIKTMSYGTFLATVAGGKKDVSSSSDLVMPALGTDKNVMCYIDAIWVYLRGRADGAIPRGRPSPESSKPPAAYTAAENECMGPN